MASIRIVSGRYQAQVRRKGMAASRTFSTREEAELWAHRLEAPLITTRAIQGGLKTVGDVLTRYEALELPKHRSGPIEAYLLRHLHRHWLGRIHCDALTAGHLAQYRDDRLQVVKPGSVRRVFNLLRPMVDLARDEWGAPFNGNPARKVTVRVGDDSRQGRLQQEQLQALIEALKRRRNPEIARAVELALETAMRRSELLSLTWDDIDLETATARLSMTKNGHPRTVALSPRALELLCRSEQRSGPILNCSASAIKCAMARAKAEVGIEDFCFHQTRHEAISRMWEQGLNEIEISSQSGHRDYRMLRRYSHVQAASLASKLRRIQTGPSP
jgi:integrase